MKRPAGVPAAAAGGDGQLHHREGGLLLRLPDRLPSLSESVPRQLPARRGLDGRDDPARWCRSSRRDDTADTRRRRRPWRSVAVLPAGSPPGDVVGLIGELGSGKTQFVSGVCEGLGVTVRVTSPTFTLINEYPAPAGNVVHIDLYRIDTGAELAELGIEEYFNDRNICLDRMGGADWGSSRPGAGCVSVRPWRGWRRAGVRLHEDPPGRSGCQRERARYRNGDQRYAGPRSR